MKKWIKEIPLVGDFLVRKNRKNNQSPHFNTSGEYWKERYRLGGNSGAGSYNNLAEFRGEIINRLIKRKSINSVIEFGCGDGNQLKYLKSKSYLGFDISKEAIQLCENIFKNDDTKSFKLMDSYDNEKAELTMSLDVIYHLIEEQSYHNYMITLFESSNQYVTIYSSNTDENKSSVVHVKHRKFTDWVEKNQKEFRLLEHIPNKYPPNANVKKTSFADFYIYEK